MHAAISAAVLAGGKSSRMRTTKAFLEVGGKPVIARIIAELAPRFDEVLIVTNESERYAGFPARVVTDVIPGRGPLSGIHAALCHAANPSVFVTACDLPFLSGMLAHSLADMLNGYDCAVPVIHNYVEPLYAVYSRVCIPHIEACLDEGRRKVVDLLSRVRVKYIQESDIAAPVSQTFFNINYPHEWAQARAIARHGGTPPKLPPFICITGASGTGKTVLVTRLVTALRETYGLRVGTIKHAPHGADLAVEGTDSWRHFNSGARTAAVITPHEVVAMQRTDKELPLEDVLLNVTDVDLVLVEGYKTMAYPKIILNAGAVERINTAGVVAVAGNAIPGLDVPCYNRNDVSGLARAIVDYLGLGRAEE